jgi:AcrR family transcriptional regulator
MLPEFVMTQSLSTRERIVQASLELFNAQGERSVTTNHIAAHLGISPGNLYYHYRNKQAIIAELFGAYEREVRSFLQVPTDRPLTLDDKASYLKSLLDVMWRYRFLHRDLEHLLDSDAQLAERYRVFSAETLANARRIYQGFVDAGILRMTPRQVEMLSLNAWILATSWVRYLCTTSPTTTFDEAQLQRGLYQVLALEEGYLSESAREALQPWLDRYSAG